MKITCKPDCGNAPKMELIRQLSIALASVDVARVSEIITDNVTWNIVGDRIKQGKSNVLSTLIEISDTRINKLELTTIVTHGRDGAVHGTFKLESGQVFAFSEFFAFTSVKDAKVKAITTYIIELRKPDS